MNQRARGLLSLLILCSLQDCGAVAKLRGGAERLLESASGDYETHPCPVFLKNVAKYGLTERGRANFIAHGDAVKSVCHEWRTSQKCYNHTLQDPGSLLNYVSNCPRTGEEARPHHPCGHPANASWATNKEFVPGRTCNDEYKRICAGGEQECRAQLPKIEACCDPHEPESR